MVTDPIADFITQLKNAGNAGLENINVPHSSVKQDIADLLIKEGYIKSTSRKGKKSQKLMELSLSFTGTRPRIKGVKRLSKPSKRLYVGYRDIKPVKQGTGLLVVSTPKGVLSGMEARKQKIGGEPLFEIW